MGSFIDLTGQKFGHFTVSGPAGRNKHNQLIWQAVCSCGSVRELVTGKLTSGKAKSCGCQKKAICSRQKLEDLTGKRFGRLVVTGIDSIKARRSHWACECDCGQKVVIMGCHLKSGSSTSCGCFRREHLADLRTIDLTGVRSGKLVAVRPVCMAGRSRLWLCRCDCGGSKIIAAARISFGAVISCGCVKAGRGHIPLLPARVRHRASASRSLRRARARNAGGRFTPAEIEALYQKQRGRCAWCRTSLKQGYHRDHRQALANGGDNTIQNIQLLCPTCNQKKWKKDEVSWAQSLGLLC